MSDMPITEAIRRAGLAADPSAFTWLPWLAVGEAIYVEVEASDGLLIGKMDTARLAEEAVNAHNTVLARVQAAAR